MSMIVNLKGMPKDPVERLIWLNGIKDAVEQELEPVWRQAYYDARLQNQFDYALALKYHSKKNALAMTRRENKLRGQGLRWGDHRDPASKRHRPKTPTTPPDREDHPDREEAQ